MITKQAQISKQDLSEKECVQKVDLRVAPITAKGSSDKVLRIQVEHSVSIYELRQTVCRELDVPEKSVHLLVAGRPLNDNAGLALALRGATIEVVPRIQSGFDLSRRQFGKLPVGQLDSVEDVLKAIEGMANLDGAGLSVMIEDENGKVVEKEVPIGDLVSTLTQLKRTVESKSGATAGPAEFNAAPTETAEVSHDMSKRRKLQEAYDKAREMQKENERKKGEAMRMTSKLEALREKRERSRRRREKLRQRRHSSMKDSSRTEDIPKASPQTGFAGFKKGFLA